MPDSYRSVPKERSPAPTDDYLCGCFIVNTSASFCKREGINNQATRGLLLRTRQRRIVRPFQKVELGSGDIIMEIKRAGSQPSSKGPADWFTGTVRIDPLFQ